MPPGGPKGGAGGAVGGGEMDKRTAAYESIFGRPSAKPKGPAPPPQSGGYAPYQLPPQMAATQNWVHNQAMAGSQPPGPYGQPPPRWHSPAPPGPYRVPTSGPPPHVGSGMYMPSQPSQGGQYGADPIDRRASTAPSIASGGSGDPRMSYYGNPGGLNASDMYGAGAGSQGQGNGYPQIPSRSATPSQSEDISPRAPPQIPGLDLPKAEESDEGHWFSVKPGSSNQAAQAAAAAAVNAKAGGHFADAEEGRKTPTSPLRQDVPLAAATQSLSALSVGGGGADEDGVNDFQEYQRRIGANNGGNGRSAASSVYGDMRRRGSFESDAPSVANSMFTLSAPSNNGQLGPRMYSSGASGMGPQGAGQHPGYFGSVNMPPMGGYGPYQQRMRTTSSATQAAQAAYAPSYADSNLEWRKSVESTRAPSIVQGMTPAGQGRFEARSMSAGQSIRPGIPTALSSPHGSIGSAAVNHPPVPSRRGPLVYPALLSRVAEAFKSRVTLSERTKDGLSYTDAFDGREAVDKIAYIIKTTDRNLALLLGRALDAQKFFHDVTYDHRLRDSPNELYQFRVRLTSPFGSEDDVFEDANDGQAHGEAGSRLSVPLNDQNGSRAPTRDSSAASLTLGGSSAQSVTESNVASTPATSTRGAGTQSRNANPAPMASGYPSADMEEEDALPTGVFTLLTDCYSPTCTRDRLCYSIACPRRLEQQARLNMKPQAVLKRSLSKESLGETKEQGALWAESVSKEILESVSEKERKRQELINEVIYTERDFVRDLEYLRDFWIKPLRTRDIIADARRDDFVTQVFWNVLEIHAVNSKLADMLGKRQKQQAVVERIGDLLLEMVPYFQPFVKYGAHQLYGKYEFEKEKASNPAFLKFVEETERLPESRKLELNGYLTKPTTRLARYPLLLEGVAKATEDDSPDKQALPKVIKIVKEFLSKVNTESGKSENRFNLAQLDQQLVFKQGEAVDLRLRDEQRELVFKGPLKRRGGSQSESGDLQVFLFDHALLMAKAKNPIPLELLIVTVYDEVPTGKGTATRPKSVMSRTSTGNRLSGGVPTGSAPKQDQKTGYALTFTYLGRKGYTQTLWASTFVSRKKWFEHIEARQDVLRQRSNIFDTITLSESFFSGPAKVTCSVPFDFGRRIIYGTDDGVYLSDLREKARPPTKVLPLPGVTQMDVLEEYQILIILAERSVHTFTLDALDPSDPMGSLKRGRRISSHTSFFKAGQCLGRTLVCVVKSSSLSSTIKTLEPIEQNVRGKKQPTFRKLLQGGQETLRVFKEFYIPTESSSIHFLKSKLCVGCTKGFEIVDLETLDTQGLLDPADSNLDFVQRKETVKPIAIYRIDGEFLLCYDEFAFYVNKNGWRSKGNWIIHWEGNPTSFAYHHPYVLAFEPSFIEVRHVQTGALHQVITGYNLRCLFADVAPPASSSSSSVSSSAASSKVNLHGSPAPNAMNSYGRPPYPGAPPMAPDYPPGGLSRAQSFQMGMNGAPPGAAYGRPPMGPGPRPPPYGPQPGQPMYRPGVPFAFTAAQAPRPPPLQRNPVWESVAASRNQIVFMGDTTVFCIRPANTSSLSNSISSAGGG
ncbi:cnh-domain-containing protein [Ceraceosorus bombacis]|uniref:Cnh-domain-containing protein n=1 Tax=Ceraceosorus bombacis TaxID=401625 RepID=A0A0P1BQN5_9BASI|nr:cnh-domain-containing protein [Ceraceosorus bombacis]